jgi:esterase/lipase superfamily enzyme
MIIKILRIIGIGKTKTVVKILSDNDLKYNCMFFKSPEEYNNNSKLKNYINRNKNISLILVIYECDKGIIQSCRMILVIK